MNSEGYQFENQKPQRQLERTETVPLLVSRNEPASSGHSQDMHSSGDTRRTFFDTQNQGQSFIRGVGKTSLILTLATAELLVSATAVLAGTVFAGAWIHYPIGLLIGSSMAVNPLGPIIVIGTGVLVGAIGLRRMNSAFRRMKSVF